MTPLVLVAHLALLLWNAHGVSELHADQLAALAAASILLALVWDALLFFSLLT